MISIEVVLMMIWIHFFSDFIMQSDDMAKGKSSDNRWLAVHVIIYSLPFLWFGVWFTVANGVAHYATDYFSSRATSYLHKREKHHWFFVVIGLDQAIHATTLVLTYYYLVQQELLILC